MVGIAEVGLCLEVVVNGEVVDVFKTVIVGDRASHFRRLVSEAVEDGGLDVF